MQGNVDYFDRLEHSDSSFLLSGDDFWSIWVKLSISICFIKNIMHPWHIHPQIFHPPPKELRRVFSVRMWRMDGCNKLQRLYCTIISRASVILRRLRTFSLQFREAELIPSSSYRDNRSNIMQSSNRPCAWLFCGIGNEVSVKLARKNRM
jgi:hypothetical protein